MSYILLIHSTTPWFSFRLPTDVQSEAIPLILGGGDVLMAAETGSGKTGAFCLPILQIVWETLKDLESGKGSKTLQSQICMNHIILCNSDINCILINA